MTSACEHLDDPDWENLEGAVLIAGDAHDVAGIRDICTRLPWDANGVVMIEAVARVQQRRIDVPDGVSVRWLLRGEGTSARTRGERLATAVHAWCVEWTCSDEPAASWTLWLGPHTPPRVAQMARSLLGVGTPPDA